MGTSTRRVRRRRLVIIVGLLSALGSLGWAATAGPLLRVRTIRIQGNARVSGTSVLALVGDVRDAHMASIDLAAIERRLASHPWILRSDADRSLPWTLVVSITERSPVAWAEDPLGVLVVASDGVVLERRTNPPRGIELPPVPIVLQPGDVVPSADLAMVAGSLSTEVREKVAAIRIGTTGVVLELGDGGRVLYGEASEFAEKAAAILSLLRWGEQQGIAIGYVDVRAPRTPTLKPAK